MCVEPAGPSKCTFQRLNTKLARAAKDLKIWVKGFFSETRLQMHMANEIILHFDIAQECRHLSSKELQLRRELKLRVLGLAAIDRARKRQASWVTWLRAGDAKTMFFQAKINSRRQKNFIQALHS